ncbi:cdkn1a interacting zinc finger protein 1a [Oryzias melastigma]|uniref:Cdkn1a interacting zinc finger protein 1a n=1 Tax=Oryzias melastigma TaxID=30732 RepID=A0A3B3BDX9_ORYME|nr:cdkn1a interacting zinc finger protein 1a [Oryzias melastigma]
MFNPHIHQQQQQQQLQQHLRHLHQLFQQQPPPPPPPQPPPAHHVAHHHQTQRAIPVQAQAAPPPRMVNLCQTNQTTIIAPNPMLQGALLMQQMQGNIRSFGMGGQQFRQFYAAGSRSSLLGPVPMGMAIKSPIMGFPAARPFHPHTRFFNPTTSASVISATDVAARHADRKRDSEQMAGGSTDDQPAATAAAATATSSTSEAADKTQADGSVASVEEQNSEEQLKEPLMKRQKTEGSEKPKIQSLGETASASHLELNSNAEEVQPEGTTQEDSGSSKGSDVAEVLEDTIENQDYSCLSANSPSGQPSEEDQKVNPPAEEHKDTSLASPASQEEDDEGVAEGSNKFYCYLCSITCHNQQNFRSHMNSISHQQRMMEIQYMSNACLVTLLPRVQESLQGANKDGEKKSDSKRWCATCHSHFTCSTTEHRCSEEHKLATTTNVSFCIVCKKHFKTSQHFLEHLHTQGHRQKLQEKGCDALVKLTALDTDEFSLENEEGSGGEGETEGNQGDTQDGWSSLKEVTLNDISSDEQYDPDTIYGPSFLVPVAGFICKLCNKFYHFESSAAHTHCKSLKHFENLRSYRELVIQKGEGGQSSRKSCVAADSGGPATQSSTDCSEKDVASNRNSLQSSISVNQLEIQKEKQPAETDSNLQDFSALSAGSPDEALSTHHKDEENSPYASAAPESEADLLRSSAEEADSEPAAVAENSNEEEEAPAGPGKKNGTGKGKAAPKRRSGRAANRR